MKNALLLNHKFDFQKTEESVVQQLQKVKRPMNYNELFYSCSVRSSSSNEVYSDNTDPKEKFRQYFCDHKRSNVVFISGGMIALRDWFPSTQNNLFQPEPYNEKILGNCGLSFDAGYECAKREPYLKDWFNDSLSIHRFNRRKRAALVEFHVRNFFKINYNQFFVEPSNNKKYEIPAIDDFGLNFPISKGRHVYIKVDVKSFSKDGKDGVVRSPKDKVVYLFADIDEYDNVWMYGFGKGDYLNEIGIKEGSLSIIRNNFLLPIDKLIVMLNICSIGMDYIEVLNNIIKHDY